MSFRVIGNRIVVKQTQAEEATKSGILLPDSAKEKPYEGVVVAVGPGRILENGEREEIQVKAGDKIIYSKFGGIDLKIEGEDYLVLTQNDILVVVE